MNDRTTTTPPLSLMPSSLQCAESAGEALSIGLAPNGSAETELRNTKPDNTSIGVQKIGLIDWHQLSQECLRHALETIGPGLIVYPFGSMEDCIARQTDNFDIIIYFWHASDTSVMTAMDTVSAARAAFDNIPLVILSDEEEVQHPKTIRIILKSGARGFIPTRTTGIKMAVAAIRFVKAGGTFAPLDLLLPGRPGRQPTLREVAPRVRLTARQMMILSHLHQGKANKIIANELRMSESTVKVHVRNIMRKMGATNRTQAVYKAQRMWDPAEFTNIADP